MPDQNKKIISKYQGDKNPDKRYLKLGRKSPTLWLTR